MSSHLLRFDFPTTISRTLQCDLVIFFRTVSTNAAVDRTHWKEVQSANQLMLGQDAIYGMSGKRHDIVLFSCGKATLMIPDQIEDQFTPLTSVFMLIDTCRLRRALTIGIDWNDLGSRWFHRSILPPRKQIPTGSKLIPRVEYPDLPTVRRWFGVTAEQTSSSAAHSIFLTRLCSVVICDTLTTHLLSHHSIGKEKEKYMAPRRCVFSLSSSACS